MPEREHQQAEAEHQRQDTGDLAVSGGGAQLVAEQRGRSGDAGLDRWKLLAEARDRAPDRRRSPRAPRRRCAAPRRGRSRRRAVAGRATGSSRRPVRGWGRRSDSSRASGTARRRSAPTSGSGDREGDGWAPCSARPRRRGRRRRAGTSPPMDWLMPATSRSSVGVAGEVGQQLFLAGDRVEVARSVSSGRYRSACASRRLASIR